MKFIAFDIETTGLIPGSDRITEIAAVKFIDGQPTELFSTLVNPQKIIPEEVIRVSGITNEMVQGQPVIEDLLESFANFCQDIMMIAHNASFDFQFIAKDIQKYEAPAPKGVVLDTLALSKKVIPGLMNYKLGTLVNHLKIEADVFHRAQHDATYTGYLFHHLLNKLTINGQIPSLETLVQISGRPLVFPQIEKKPKQLDLLGLD